MIKNAIDWGARPYSQYSWSGRQAAITGASPAAIGAALTQLQLRQILGILGVLVMGVEAYVSFKPDPVDANGTITDENARTFLQAFIERFASLPAQQLFARAAAA